MSTGIAGRKALVKVTGAPVTFTAEATTDLGDHQRYQITDAAKRLWDRDTALIVAVGGVTTVESYTVNRLLGMITFATVNGARGSVTVSGKSLPASVAMGARQFSIDVSTTIIDDSDFDNVNTAGGFALKDYATKDVSGSIGRRLRADHYFADALIAGAPVVLELYADRSAAPYFTLWGILNKEEAQAAIDGTQDGTVSFDGAADQDGNTIAIQFPA